MSRRVDTLVAMASRLVGRARTPTSWFEVLLAWLVPRLTHGSGMRIHVSTDPEEGADYTAGLEQTTPTGRGRTRTVWFGITCRPGGVSVGCVYPFRRARIRHRWFEMGSSEAVAVQLGGTPEAYEDLALFLLEGFR